MKNKFVSHSSTYSLTETEFLSTWKEIRQCIIELGGNDYTKRIDYLLTSEINPVIENELSIALEKLKESDQERARMNIDFEERFQSLQQELNMHKRKRFKKTRASECSGTVPLTIRISGDIVPSANRITPADFASEDLCVNSFKEGSLIIDLDISRSAIRNVGYFLNVIDMLLSALLQRDPAPVMDSSKYVIVSMEFPSLDTYTKENLQTSDIYKTEQSVKRQKKEAESEPNDLKKKSRGLGQRSKRKEKKSSDTSLIDNDLMRTSFSNPSLVHFETSRTRPSSIYGAHFTSGNDSFGSDQDTYVSKLRERQIKRREDLISRLNMQRCLWYLTKPSDAETSTGKHMKDDNDLNNDTKKKQRMLSLTKTSGTETSTRKHMKDDKDFGSDKKKKQRMLSLTKTSGTETSTRKHMKDDKDFGSDKTLLGTGFTE